MTRHISKPNLGPWPQRWGGQEALWLALDFWRKPSQDGSARILSSHPSSSAHRGCQAAGIPPVQRSMRGSSVNTHPSFPARGAPRTATTAMNQKPRARRNLARCGVEKVSVAVQFYFHIVSL